MSDDQPSTETTIALVQMTCGESKQDNVDKAIARIEDAAGQGADLVCLQELFHNRYPCQNAGHNRFENAEPISGPTAKTLMAAARHGLLGVCFCWDQWFPEAARQTASAGASVILYPTAI